MKLALDHHYPTAIAEQLRIVGHDAAARGLVSTSDASLPRTHATIGRYVKLLDALFREHPKPDELVDRIHWL